VSQYQKDKTSLDFTEARNSMRQWHQLGHMQVCNSLQTNDQASNSPRQARCLSYHPTNSVKALKATFYTDSNNIISHWDLILKLEVYGKPFRECKRFCCTIKYQTTKEFLKPPGIWQSYHTCHTIFV